MSSRHSYAGHLLFLAASSSLLHRELADHAGVHKSGERTLPYLRFHIEFLRMALNRHHEGMVGDLQHFRYSVFGIAANENILAWLFDSLVMQTVHTQLSHAQH